MKRLLDVVGSAMKVVCMWHYFLVMSCLGVLANVQSFLMSPAQVNFNKSVSLDGVSTIYDTDSSKTWLLLVEGSTLTAKCSYKDKSKHGGNLKIFMQLHNTEALVSPTSTVLFKDTKFARFDDIAVPPNRSEWLVWCDEKITQIPILVQRKPLKVLLLDENCAIRSSRLRCKLQPSLPEQKKYVALFHSAKPLRVYYHVTCQLTRGNETVNCSATFDTVTSSGLEEFVVTDTILNSTDTEVTVSVICTTPLASSESETITFEAGSRAQLDSVTGLMVTSLASTSVCLVWKLPHDCQHGCAVRLLICWQSQNTSHILDSSSRTHCLHSLQPFTNYTATVLVRPLTSRSWSESNTESTAGFTTEEIPPSCNPMYTVGNYILTRLPTFNSTDDMCESSHPCPSSCGAVKVFWEQVPRICMNGGDFGYMLKYRRRWENMWEEIQLTQNQTSWTLCFSRSTKIEVQVLSRNRLGHGPANQPSMFVITDVPLLKRKDLIITTSDRSHLQVVMTTNELQDTAHYRIFLHYCKKAGRYREALCSSQMHWREISSNILGASANRFNATVDLDLIIGENNSMISNDLFKQTLFGIQIVQLSSSGNGIISSGIVVPTYMFCEYADIVEEVTYILADVTGEAFAYFHFSIETSCDDVCAPADKYEWRVCEVGAGKTTCHEVYEHSRIVSTNSSRWKFLQQNNLYNIFVRSLSKENQTSVWYPGGGLNISLHNGENNLTNGYLIFYALLSIFVIILVLVIVAVWRCIKKRVFRENRSTSIVPPAEEHHLLETIIIPADTESAEYHSQTSDYCSDLPSPSAFHDVSPSPSAFHVSPSPSAFQDVSPRPSALHDVSPSPSAFHEESFQFTNTPSGASKTSMEILGADYAFMCSNETSVQDTGHGEDCVILEGKESEHDSSCAQDDNYQEGKKTYDSAFNETTSGCACSGGLCYQKFELEDEMTLDSNQCSQAKSEPNFDNSGSGTVCIILPQNTSAADCMTPRHLRDTAEPGHTGTSNPLTKYSDSSFNKDSSDSLVCVMLEHCSMNEGSDTGSSDSLSGDEISEYAQSVPKPHD